jgi:osmotically inducible protein OsmC
MVKRHATAVWQGGLKDGKGKLSTTSGALKDVPYSFAMRFENEPGTNPEELVAAALAGCFSMKLSGVLGEKGLKADRIETQGTANFEKTEKGWLVGSIHLELTAKVPGADPTTFQHLADEAKRTCPMSQLLSPGTKITLSAKLA